MYPLKIKAPKYFIEELKSAEYGRYEDACCAREKNDVELIEANNYDCVLVDFIDRWKTQIEVRNDQELCELYYALASGLIGLYGYSKKANQILDTIRPNVENIDPELVKFWPFQQGA